MTAAVTGLRALRAARWESFRATKVFGSLDGLRAISIVGVIWHHAARGRDLPFAEQGAMGVPLFFVISGFLITTLMLRERERTGSISLAKFYARRSLRIFPLYYTVLLGYVAIVFVVDRNSGPGQEFFRNLPFFATYTSNWFVRLEGRVIFYFAWSLATEEQFYILWPSVERFLPRHWPVGVALALVALWWLARANLLPLEEGSLARSIILAIAPGICLGVVAAHVLHSRAGFSRVAPALGWRWSSTVLMALVVALLVIEVEPMVVFAAMTLLVGSCVVREDHALAPALRLDPMQSIGQTSYGIYLFHMLALNLVEKALGRMGLTTRMVVFPVATLVAWGSAWLSYRYYEARFLKMKGRFSA